MTASGRPSVLLIDGLTDRRHPSMRRFGAELEHALAAADHVRLEPTVRLAPLGLDGLDPYLARYIRAPLAVARRRRSAAVFHLIDQSDGHLAGVTPASRTVVSCHDLMLLRAREGTAGFRGRAWTTARFAWSASFLRRVARVVCATDATKADVVRLGGVAPERISVVAYGVGGQFRPLGPAVRERVRRGLGIGGPAILHVSSGQPYKNVATTLRVLAGLRAAHIDATLLRVGATLSKTERKLERELRLDPAVLELGVVDDARLAEIYNAADALLFPSHAEGFGLPPLEAMACGTPVVTSADHAMTEVVADAGLRADARDVEGLVQAVTAVIRDPKLADRLRARGRERAAGYSWERTATGYEAIYASLS